MKKLKVLMLGLVCVFALTGQTDLAPSPVALRTQLGAVGGYLEDTPETVEHCIFDGATSMPDCGKRNIKHRGVGPFGGTTSNFTLGTGADVLDFTGDFYACMIFNYRSGDYLLMDGDYQVAGWDLRVASGIVRFSTHNAAGTPKNFLLSAAAPVVNAKNVVCGGRAGTTGFVKLNNAATVTGSAYVTASLTTIARLGSMGVSTAGSWLDGEIYEVIAAPTTPSDALFTEITNAAMNCTTPGRCFPEDPNEVIHLDGDDYNGGAWNGNPDRSTHSGVDSFGKPSAVLSYGSGTDPMDFAGDYTTCTVFRCDVSPSTGKVLMSDGIYSGSGYYSGLVSPPSSITAYNSWGAGLNVATPAVVFPLKQTAIQCSGRSGATLSQKVNGGTTAATGGVTVLRGTALSAAIGGLAGGGSASTECSISEFWASSTPWNESNVAAIQAAAMSRKGDGPALSQAATDPNTVMFVVGDDFTGASIKSRKNTGAPTDWAVNGVLKSSRDRYSWPASTFTLVGDVRWSESRLNWPSLSFTMNGTVSKVTTSSSYPKGFGVEHGGLGGWSGSNYLQAGTGSDVLDTAGDLTVCAIFRPGAAGSAQHVLSNGTLSVDGWYLSLASSGQPVFFTATAGANAQVTSPTTIPQNVISVVCAGRAGTSGLLQLNNEAVVSTAGMKTTAGTTSPLRLGQYSPGGNVLGGTLYEVYYTTTTPSAALLTQLTSQALSCTTPGKCFQPDANAVMHCDLDGDWSNNTLRCGINKGNDPWTTNGALTQTKAKYQWPAGATMADREGAGPYSNANYFSQPTAGILDLGTTGSATVEMVVAPNSQPAGGTVGIFGNKNGGGGAQGVDAYYNNLGNFACRAADGTSLVTATVSSSLSVGGPQQVACVFIRSGGNITVKATANGVSTTSTGALGSITSTNPIKVGREVYTSIDNFPGTISEFHVISRALSDTELAARAKKFLAQQGTYGEPITVVNTAPATCEVDGTIYNVPANTLCHQNGARAYRGGTTNLAQYSEQLDHPNWGGTVVCTPDNLIAPDGTLTADTCTVPGAGASQSRIAVFNTTAARYTDSIWVRAGGATSMAFGIYQSGFVPQTGRVLSGPGAVSGTGVITVTGLSTTQWTHVATTTDGNMAVASASVNFYPGSAGTQVITDSVGLWGHQPEAQPFATSYCGPTLNATKTCNADAVTVPNPFFQPGGLDLSFDRFGNE